MTQNNFDINPWDTTPSLSSFNGAIPKTYKAKKVKKPINPVGKKTQEWETARKELKKIFEKNGTTKCELQLEGCWKKKALGFAHKDKRRNLSVDDLMDVALLCNPCHAIIEAKPREEMAKIVDDIIAKRKWKM